MITTRDWWLGVFGIVLALLLQAIVPRYEYHDLGLGAAGWQWRTEWVRVDRWTGQARLMTVSGGGAVPQRP